jgi:hypothetical protein
VTPVVTCISTKIEDGGHFFRLKYEVSKIWEKGERVLYIVTKVLSNEKIKIYIAISL